MVMCHSRVLDMCLPGVAAARPAVQQAGAASSLVWGPVFVQTLADIGKQKCCAALRGCLAGSRQLTAPARSARLPWRGRSQSSWMLRKSVE